MSPRAAGSSRRFPGLDSLRFWAAFFVFLGHVPMTQASRGLPGPTWSAAFFRGSSAVSFFFTLSGFLITYLLLDERERKGRIDLRAFYLRRVLRIWPLYFAVIGFGLFFYNRFLPALHIAYPVEYDWRLAALLYVFFLPNLMNSWYTVGGILNPTWSIGIEEQFYLTWAPVVARFARFLPWICAGVLIASLGVQVTAFEWASGWQARFLEQLKFHFMAAGGLAAWALRRRGERLFAHPIFSSKWLQALLAFGVVQFYLWPVIPSGWWQDELLQLALYPWLILEVAANPRSLLRIATRATEWLGGISYGLYMLHMPAVYATAFVFLRTSWWKGNLVTYLAAFYLLAFGLTVALAAASHRWFEGPLLALKSRFAR